MKEAKALNLMGILMLAQCRAHRAIICAGCARTPHKENRKLRYLGRSLAEMGTINTAAAFQAFINPPARNLAYPIPACMPVILSVIQGFTFISGIIAMTIGWFLFVNDNPRHHRRLAKMIILLIQFASAFALGILLLG